MWAATDLQLDQSCCFLSVCMSLWLLAKTHGPEIHSLTLVFGALLSSTIKEEICQRSCGLSARHRVSVIGAATERAHAAAAWKNSGIATVFARSVGAELSLGFR